MIDTLKWLQRCSGAERDNDLHTIFNFLKNEAGFIAIISDMLHWAKKVHVFLYINVLKYFSSLSSDD